jgi:adenine-specific DNA-methyltransferase
MSIFNYAKPVELIHDLMFMANCTEGTILDFFAGSGTTLHATMQLNAEDGGHRQCILCTNNENNICEEVTYERNKRVINGYTTPKGVEVEGLHDNSLRYYKIKDVPRDSSTTGLKKLMLASTDLLCIKNDLYEEQSVFGNIKLRKNIARYFDDGKQKMLIIYKVDAIESIVEEIKKMPADTFIKVYVFSTNNYAMDADFEEVSDKVFLCALPAAIYNAYRKVLPRKNNVITEEEEE